MDRQTARQLAALTAEFYRTQAASFSATRNAPWPGWQRLLQEAGLQGACSLQVLDMACGNGRFGRFLQGALPGCALAVHGVDSCAGLVSLAEPLPGGVAAGREGAPYAVEPEGPACGRAPAGSFQQLDVVGSLIEERPLPQLLAAPACDLSVSFGFLHHVPGAGCRVRLLQALAEKTRPGGCVAVSLWKFMDDGRLAEKAVAATRDVLARYPALGLEQGDYLLGWQRAEGAYRYCHHFSAPETDSLSHVLDGTCTLLARFSSDGRAAAGLNEYLVWRKGG